MCETVILQIVTFVDARYSRHIGRRERKMMKILLSRKLGELRWTQADLARKTGIRPSTINELYHEIAERVNLEHLDLICDALDCDLDEILVRVPNPEEKDEPERAKQKV